MIRSMLCVLMAMLSLSGCLSPVAMHRAVIEYDRTVNAVEAEMLLLNIARAKQGQPRHFTAISSVAATFDFRSNAGFGSQLFAPSGPVFARNFFLFNLGATVAENPTVSIVPVQGEDFTKRILTPMDETQLDFLLAQGVEPAIVLRLMGRGLAVEEDGKRTFYLNMPHRPDEYREFRRRVLHLSALNLARRLHVGFVTFEEIWPLPLDHPMTSQALEKGYQLRQDDNSRPYLAKRVIGRLAITNYDPMVLTNEERRRLVLKAERYPRNYVLVDIRPNYPGGDYPWHGQIKLRSFNAMLEFLARGIEAEPEFDVPPDPRSGPVLRNPVKTLAILESATKPTDAVFAAELEGRWYALDNRAEGQGDVQRWNREAFELMSQLYQMTVTDVAKVQGLPITIAK
ncbi:MAG: hypothetical protein NNA23_12175 [Nitrospira sp.]|nr:hypothetical protein [Nitrospira sp.]